MKEKPKGAGRKPSVPLLRRQTRQSSLKKIKAKDVSFFTALLNRLTRLLYATRPNKKKSQREALRRSKR
jgi:hypothetical protein